MTEPPRTTPPATRQPPPWAPLRRLDEWMDLHPFHPRLVPFLVYIAFLFAIGYARQWQPITFPFLYALQIAAVGWLLWRYRRRMPELTLHFHWLAVPLGMAAAAAWMGLALAMERLNPGWFAHRADSFFEQMGPAAAWASMTLRLLGMAALVPVFEELLFRSALLRALYRPRDAGIAIIQLLEDLPILGDRIMRTELSRRLAEVRSPLADAFHRVPLGRISLFAIAASLIIWALVSHIPRDWPGTIACGLLYIFLLCWTNRPGRPQGPRLGLGPVIWAHGITNAILWVYTLSTGDWRFL